MRPSVFSARLCQRRLFYVRQSQENRKAWTSGSAETDVRNCHFRDLTGQSPFVGFLRAAAQGAPAGRAAVRAAGAWPGWSPGQGTSAALPRWPWAKRDALYRRWPRTWANPSTARCRSSRPTCRGRARRPWLPLWPGSGRKQSRRRESDSAKIYSIARRLN